MRKKRDRFQYYMSGLQLGLVEYLRLRGFCLQLRSKTLINIDMIYMWCKIFGRSKALFMTVVKVIQDKKNLTHMVWQKTKAFLFGGRQFLPPKKKSFMTNVRQNVHAVLSHVTKAKHEKPAKSLRSTEGRETYGFGTAWGWANDDRRFILTKLFL